MEQKDGAQPCWREPRGLTPGDVFCGKRWRLSVYPDVASGAPTSRCCGTLKGRASCSNASSGPTPDNLAAAKRPEFLPALAQAIAQEVAAPLQAKRRKRKVLAVQVGAFANPQGAEQLLRRLEARFKGYIVQKES